MISPMAAAILLTLSVAAHAAEAGEVQVQCRAPGALPPELEGWNRATPLAGASDAQRLPVLALGQAADLALLPASGVKYPVQPERPGGPGSFGGFVGIEIAQAGTYRVALGSGAWIDVVRGGEAVVSVAHGHGPECTGVRKIVDFPLTPGRYTLQLSASAGTNIRVLVVHAP